MRSLKLLYKTTVLALFQVVLFGCNPKNEKGTEENQGKYVFRDNSLTKKTDYKFKTKNDTFESSIELTAINDTVFNFKLFYKDFKNNCNLNLKGILKNIDPNADFDESDPNGNGEPTQIFEFVKDKIRVEMAIPYYEPTIVGVRIQNFGSETCILKKLKFNLIK